jgi:hypothetical protein
VPQLCVDGGDLPEDGIGLGSFLRKGRLSARECGAE